MATQLGENTKITLDLKTIGMVVVGAVSLAAMYFTLKKDIELAKELPEPTIIPALKIVVAYFFEAKISSTFFLERKCLDSSFSLVMPLK